MQRSFLPPLHGEGGRREAETGWGGLEVKGAAPGSPQRPHPTSPDGSATLPMKGREKGVLWIEGYASLWGAADLNGDVVARGAFVDSLARTGAGGVRMLHQHESRAVVGVWDEMVEDERGLRVRGRIHDWSAEARYAQALTRAGALDGLSIGFCAAKARRDGRLRVLSQVELWEVSLVTFSYLMHYTAFMTVIAYSYARFSSPAQAHGDSVRRQMEAAEHYAAEHNLILDTSLRDHAVSAYRGAHRTSGALSRFLENVVAGRIAEGSCLLLDSFDRLSREHPTEALGLLLDITRRGVAVVFLSSGKIFGRQTEPTDLMWALFESTRSHNESLEKGRKLAAVRAQERKRAREGLTPFTPVGPHWLSLTTDANGKKLWEKIPKRVAVVQQVFNMKESGLGYAAIARKMNEVPVPTARPRKGRPGVWSEATVSDLIYSRTVLGEYAPHKGHRSAGKREPDGPPIPGFYPPIIEPDQFHRVHAMIRTRQNPNAQPRSRLFKNLLVGQAICGACGGTVGFHQSTARPTRTGEIRGALRCNNVNRGACGNRHRLPYKSVERDLMPFLAALSAAQAAIPAQAVSVQELARARMNRDALQTRIDALLDALEEGRGVSGRLAEREAEADALDREIANLEREAAIERAQAAAPNWRDRQEEIRRQMETAQGDALYEARAAMSALIAVAVPLGFEFRDGLLFANFNESSSADRPRLYYGGDGSVIRWEFAAGGPTFDQVKAAV